MADGTSKPIDDIKVGDKVVATDPTTGQTGPRTVVGTIATQGRKDLVKLTVDTDGAVGDETGTVVATAAHPIWVPTKGRWLDASAVRARDSLRTAHGTQVHVVTVRAYNRQQRVHNLSIAGIHTYYVLAGNTSVLVHNCGGVDNLSRAAGVPDRNGLTAAGRAAQKHGNRQGSGIDLPADRTAAAYNAHGQDLVDDLLTAPNTAVRTYADSSHGQVTEYLGPKYGARWGPNGNFMGFLDY